MGIEEEASEAPCDCIPACNDVSYKIQLSQTTWDLEDFLTENVNISTEVLDGETE